MGWSSRQIFWFLCCVPTLAGCTSGVESAQRQADRNNAQIERCQSLGAQTQEQMFQCRLQLQQADQAQQEAYGRQMQAMGNALIMGTPQQRQQPVYRAPVQCVTSPAGRNVVTNCY